MDISQIRKLIKLVQSSDLTEIEVTEGDHSVRISRQASHTSIASTPVQHFSAPTAAPELAPTSPAPESCTDDNIHNEANIVKSPMVGTFYSAANPDSEPFVRVGSKVKQGETLCIIEAMKLMNAIEAEYSGIVEEILVENATPLEYGQPIFVISPT